MDEEQATIEGQFYMFAKLFEGKARTGLTICLYHSDYWMRQAGILDDRKVTMTDTGILFNKFSKSEIDIDEWLLFVSELCARKELNEERVLELLTNCGLPGEIPVEVPQYRNFFLTYKSIHALFAYRRCSADGAWDGRHPNDSSPNGWTNYTPCFPPLVKSLFDKVYDDEGAAQAKFRIAEMTRYLEIVGYSTSFLAMIVSLIIFKMFRSLHNRRTMIHRNLFSATLLEITIRLCLYFDQFFGSSGKNISNSTDYSINSIPYVCEGAYVFLEYAISVMFTWMFIEGVFLNNLVTNRALRSHWSHRTYFLVGWLLPVFGTIAWAFTTGYYYLDERVNACWYGYNFHWYYWLAQGPRCIIIGLNFLFLLNIMRVLVLKLHQTINSEREKIKTAVHAALILLPLLGMTNAFSMIEVPLDSSVPVFATWCYVTHFFRSFQGLLIAVIYCFMNGEVQAAIRKRYANYRIMRDYRRRHNLNANIISAMNMREEIEMRELPMQVQGRAHGSTTTNNAAISDALESCTVECQALCCQRSPTPARRAPVVVQFAEPPLTGEFPAEIETYDPPRTT